MYVNAKMIPVETVRGIRGRWGTEVEGGIQDIVRSFGNATITPPSTTAIKITRHK
jgi:hypothetical protein